MDSLRAPHEPDVRRGLPGPGATRGPLAPVGQPGTSGRWRGPRHGQVEQYDERRGWGTVVEAGGRRYPFHCTAISDGTRRIDAGTGVVFVVAAGHHGQLEAVSLQPQASVAVSGSPGGEQARGRG